MITVTYTPTTNIITAYVPYMKLQKFTAINLDCTLFPVTKVLKRDTVNDCYIISILMPHNDVQAIIKHYQKNSKSITFIVL
jgi:hypothetical protein